MGMKPPLNEPHGAIRNASNNPTKRAHSAGIKNQANAQEGTAMSSTSHIANESDPQNSAGATKGSGKRKK
jgi:hypothetical protein